MYLFFLSSSLLKSGLDKLSSISTTRLKDRVFYKNNFLKNKLTPISLEGRDDSPLNWTNIFDIDMYKNIGLFFASVDCIYDTRKKKKTFCQ